MTDNQQRFFSFIKKFYNLNLYHYMKNVCYSLLFAALIMGAQACHNENDKAKSRDAADQQDFSLLLQDNPEWQYQDLRLVPIIAQADFIAGNEAVAGFKTLGEALNINRFKIVERQPYGRFDDMAAVNALTIQNKTQDAVFLMAGDVVQGGNQDRVIAQDMIVPAMKLRDAPVFCVEPNRWTPHANKEGEQIYAFTGYYHVASGSVRKAAVFEGNQQSVWSQVGRITALHDASTSSGTYAALEQSEDYTRKRDEYLRFFGDKFADNPNIIGLVAVRGNEEVIGADLFGHPSLFKKQYASLLHSYVTDAISQPEASAQSNKMDLANYEKVLKARYQTAQQGKFVHNGALVHFVLL